MSLYVEDNGGDFERCPTGVHLARCYRIIDVGTQKSEYLGQVKHLRKVMMAWEIHGMHDDGQPILMQDGRPFSIFKNYTLSWSEKANLRLDLQSWRGKPFTQEEMRRFDLKLVLGAWCMLNVIARQGQNGSTYSNVNGITPVPSMIKQQGLPAAVNKNEIFSISDPDMRMFEGFSESLKKKIGASPEWAKRQAKASESPSREPGSDDDYSDDIPF
ncbi:hypothetical protein UFOVP239_44 [uncultured Caudovirales phage]|uniref:Uncharacterized protein n=1 Tax=uncultured Caudovirales phage TaxID=2100421 RepID=A0A6J7WQM6_9CAUD|nr:hypothetical protein UFOVP239_44 [uncultured Caudovirales phage]